MSDFWIRMASLLPPKLVSGCAMRMIVSATTGKYENTVVPELTAIEACKRWNRIHGIAGSGKDENYDSNRGS